MPETRQSTAIMFTDIVGYSAFVGKDETAAYQLVQKNWHFQKPLLKKHGCKWLEEMGEKEQVSEWLEKSYQGHEMEIYWLRVEPTFESLRNNPRWKEMLGNIVFPE
jgi:hypothetical protein